MITAELAYRITCVRGLALATRYGEFETPELKELLERMDVLRVEEAKCKLELAKMAGVKS